MNQNKPQYHKEMEKIIEGFGGKRPKLLLHSCCAPCSSGVLVPLQEVFELTVYYYNPNLSEWEEYNKRAREQKKLIDALNGEKPDFPIGIIEEVYEPEQFYERVRGLEDCPEGGERCFLCYGLRLEKTARKAKEEGYDFFTTTLTISPLKNAEKINTIGKRLEEKYKVAFLPSDFKKKEGYKRSIELSRKYELYRQNFCGCVYSKAEGLSKEDKV
ncbi:MAG: epoxyqueuosine reductase QueH [Lachnospiraceae bacterium]|nr:epoxyqueuosine reductase QueH [Lachnospiraceae bacterium]MDD7050002.1 epoxyqueuosine reductase QueH [Lachnospiraceae bacterium]MDY3223559.1 epoxyqueuosine reductase QueH [Lachnospiraceae bacterium]MDY4095530.1 epoxyqueuosine reductase QueH [Lachnospiraceae bacterium]